MAVVQANIFEWHFAATSPEHYRRMGLSMGVRDAMASVNVVGSRQANSNAKVAANRSGNFRYPFYPGHVHVDGGSERLSVALV